ncbi:MAG: TIGR03936 family radical SAM-associated protein [Tepidiformaceae bacterium]
MAVQRFRVWFSKGERVRYISHLDVLRAWERSLRRAGLPLAYSQGFTPHPKIAFASPLPLGFTSEAELMDITLDERVDAAEFRERLTAESSPDLLATAVEEVPLNTPPPQAVLLWADYRALLPCVPLETAACRAASFLELAELPWTVEKADKSRTYDLRAAVAHLHAAAAEAGCTLSMRLSAGQELTARPEHLLAALLPGVEAALITRTGLLLEEHSPAREAWRRRGQYET